MRYCERCLYPDTKPDLSFDGQGICDACRSWEAKLGRIDWAARRRELIELLQRYCSRDGSRYDCIVPVSGGKDSHYQVHVIKNELGLKPLCVCWRPCERTAIGARNLENLRTLGVDLIEVSPDPRVYRTLMREGFIRVGDMEWPEHVGIFTAPVRVAVSYRIPLLIWGENTQMERGGPPAAQRRRVQDRRWVEEFGGLLGLRVEDFIGFGGLTRQDLLPWTYPSEKELASAAVTGIYLGSYLQWDVPRQVDIAKGYGFETLDEPVENTNTGYDKIDCKFVALHDYLKWLKYGFGRATDQLCEDIRTGWLSREEALRLVREREGKLPRRYLLDFLQMIDMSEAEFFKVLDQFTNTALFVCDGRGRLVRDADGNLIKRHDGGGATTCEMMIGQPRP